MTYRTIVPLLLLSLAVLALPGCPPSWPEPPFDTTGTYTGTWSGQPSEGEEVNECPLTITLTQNLNANYPGDHAVSGTVVVDYSCFELPEWVGTPPPSTVNVGGLLGDDGTLTLLSGGCGTGLCVVLALSGTGVDADGDGDMDSYSGTWSYSLLLAGVQPLTVTGTFEVAVDDGA